MARSFPVRLFENVFPKGRFRNLRFILSGAYLLACVLTIAGVAMSREVNEIGAELRVHKTRYQTGIDTFVEATSFVVKNGSDAAWRGVVFVLNGVYHYGLNREVKPGDGVSVFAHEFRKPGSLVERPDYNAEVESFVVTCDRGKFESRRKK